jgi:hypothetical protein
MCADRKIDITQLLADVPDLAQLPGVCRDGVFAGAPFEVAWDGTWRTTHRGDAFGLRLHDVPREDIVLDTAQGTLTLRRPLATNSSSSGTVSGVALSLSLRLAGTDGVPIALFRTYVSTPDLTSKVCFPEGYEDPSLRFHATARLPLTLGTAPAEVLFIARGPYLIVEAPAESGVADLATRFRELSGAVRMVLSYLFGIRLDRRNCDVQLDAGGRVVQVDWYAGRTGAEDTIYRPIPVSWSEWVGASRELGLPVRGGPLVPRVISAMVQTFLAEPGLAAPLEYLLRFHEVPVEMRGAFLSVALESLTDQLQKKGLFEFPKPLADDAWKAFLDATKGVVDAQEGWSKDQREVILSRLRNLNSPTNAAKLTVPFEALGVGLSDDERKAIEKRNRLLHQGRLLSPDYVRENREAWKEAYAVEMLIFTAVNKLLLVHMGYEGAVIDWGASPVGEAPDVYRLVTAPARRSRT